MFLVTGGAGFIGSNLVAALADGGQRVAVCDRLGSGEKWRNIAKHEVSEIVAPDLLFDWLAGRRLDGIFHMGAISATTERDGDLLAATNVTLPQRLWRWCAAARVPLIYASSGATYGDGAAGFDDDASPQALGRLQPLNGYGWSKHLFDRWAIRQRLDGAEMPPLWSGLKFFNVYGPNEYHKGDMRSVAVKLFEQLENGEPAVLFKSHREGWQDGGQLRDFVSVEDCTAVSLWLMENAPRDGALFNVGTGKARSFADLAHAVFAALGRPAEIHYRPMPEHLREKYQYFTEARIERLRAAGYERPLRTLEEGVGAYVRDFLMQEDRYR